MNIDERAHDVAETSTEMDTRQTLDQLVRLRQDAGRLLLALDFDGTLAPIVPRPEDATILPAALAVLERLSQRDDTLVALVSGRGLEDLRGRVPLESLYLAGNHGFEIEGPDMRHRLPEAEALRPELARVAKELRERLADLAGAQIEDKGVTLSVHYRGVASPEDGEWVREAVARAVSGIDSLRLTYGKRVVEVRPALDWHKGRAIEFLLDALLPSGSSAVAFVGDDVTDEDGFRVVRARGGVSILVSDETDRETAASGRVQSPEALVPVLERLAT